MRYKDVLQDLNLERTTVDVHARFLLFLEQISRTNQNTTYPTIKKQLLHFEQQNHLILEKQLKLIRQRWSNVQALQKKYHRQPQKLYYRIIKRRAVSPYRVHYTPLAIILWLDSHDYFVHVDGTGSNAATFTKAGVPVIVMNGLFWKSAQLQSTLRHELHHVFFALFYGRTKNSLPNIENALRHDSNHDKNAERFLSKLIDLSYEKARSEFFAYTRNRQECSLVGLGYDVWMTRLHRLNLALIELPKLRPKTRRNIYTNYVKAYQTYLKQIELYYSLVHYLLQHQRRWKLRLADILAIMALTPLNCTKLPNYPKPSSTLLSEIRQQRRSQHYQFRTYRTINPKNISNYIRHLSRFDPTDWEFLNIYLVRKKFNSASSVPLLRDILKACPSDSVRYTTGLMALVLIQDYKIKPAILTALSNVVEANLKHLPIEHDLHGVFDLLKEELSKQLHVKRFE